MVLAAAAPGKEKKVYSGAGCAAIVDDFFANEVWPKVGAQTCLECHKADGDVEDSDFVLLDPKRSQGHAQDEALRHNREQFVKMVRLKAGDQSRLLLKAVGKLKHGGKQQLKPDSAGYHVLADFVRRLNAPSSTARARAAAEDKNAPPFFDGIEEALRDENESRAAQPRLPRQERSESMLYAAQVNSKTLQRVTPYIPANIPKERLAQQAEIALASFKAGACVSANLSIGQFDSHANNDADQMKLIPEFLAGIAYVLRRAEALKIREKLVVVIQSEMGRTPNYNKGNGKDHWSIGSVMFLGPGIRGNRVIGATDEKQFHVPINPATLACDKDKGIRVRPEHIHAALRQFAGIAEHPFSKKFPLGVVEKESLRGLLGRV
jgi:hypothetical protein